MTELCETRGTNFHLTHCHFEMLAILVTIFCNLSKVTLTVTGSYNLVLSNGRNSQTNATVSVNKTLVDKAAKALALMTGTHI